MKGTYLNNGLRKTFFSRWLKLKLKEWEEGSHPESRVEEKTNRKTNIYSFIHLTNIYVALSTSQGLFKESRYTRKENTHVQNCWTEKGFGMFWNRKEASEAESHWAGDSVVLDEDGGCSKG